MSKQHYEVHPVAAMFPLMSDEELDDLAEDIKANGQRFPIIFDQGHQLLDGRNRAEACNRAGIKPISETLPDGQDAVAYILSVNVTRRHLSKGQAAMAVAKARLFATNSSTTDAARSAGVSQSRVAYASVVLTHAAELADAVMAGAMSLDAAYETAKARKQAQESREEAERHEREEQAREAKRAEQDLAKLQHDAPDLAELVIEGGMKLSEAKAAYKQRQEERQRDRQITSRNLTTALMNLDPMQMRPEARAREFLGADPQLSGFPMGYFSAERIRNVIAVLSAWLEMIEANPNGNQSQAA